MADGSFAHSLSIVVPTRNEAGNILALLQRISEATRGLCAEVIFVDDSSDATPEVIRSAAGKFPFEVILLARPPERRNGLGKAVVEGLRCAQADWVCVMDGDLQHPPEVIPQLLMEAQNQNATLVAASRLADGGGTEGLSLSRKLVSYGLAFLSRLVFPARLRQVTDPLTGFFMLRRDAVDPDALEPEGFKILLEILVRSPRLRVSEVPFEFAERHAGESKANSGEVLRLIMQMLRLQRQSQIHLARFVTVGVSGLLVNTGALFCLVEWFGLHYLGSVLLATQGSTLWNFGWTEAWVFPDRRSSPQQLVARCLGYVLMNNALLIFRGPLLALLVTVLDMHYLLANVLSLVLMTFMRFMLADRLIWKGAAQQPEAVTSVVPEQLR